MPLIKNANHELFCVAYIKHHLNAFKAYESVYGEKENRNSSEVNASKLLSNTKIAARIAELYAEFLDKEKYSANFVLEEMFKIANSDPIEMLNEDGSMKQMSDIPVHTRKTISSFEMVEYYEGQGDDREQVGWTKKVKFWSKDKQLENLGRYHKMFTDKTEVEIGNNLEKLIREAKNKGKM